MIDINNCHFEESAHLENETVYYFTYPKDLSETEFYPEEDYGNVVSMCISLTVSNDNKLEYYMQMSPTIEEGSSLIDVDWRDLYIGENYTDDMVSSLLNLTGDYNY